MTYSVYTLTDGELGTDERYDNERDAWDMFELFKGMERGRAKTDPNYVETTIHLYHSAWGNMLAEECITPDYRDPRSPLFGVNVPVTETWLQG